jgi:hypothetical protein
VLFVKLDLGCVLDDLLQKQRGVYISRGLVVVMPDKASVSRKAPLCQLIPLVTYLTVVKTSSLPAALSFFPLPTKRCLSLVLHPSIAMN